MEFKFRAVDDKPPATATTSASGFGFMAGQEMLGRGSRMCSEADPTWKPTEDQLQAAIRREIEKEQIRWEIIAAETARRRELVAEVMKEMATEREMALDRGAEMGTSPCLRSLFERQLAFADPLMSTALDNASTSTMAQPFQQMPEAATAARAKATPIVESNKNKLMVLDRPDPNGAKHKAEAPPAAAVGVLHMLGLKKKPSEEWSCALCKVSATCKSGFNEHLLGKKHKAKEAALRKEQMAKTSTTVNGRKNVSSKVTCLMKIDGGKHVKTGAGCRRNSKTEFWCEICNVGPLTKAIMLQHELGKKHKARIQEQKGNPEAAPTSKPISTASLLTTATATAAATIRVPPPVAVTEMAIGDVVIPKEKVKDGVLKCASAKGQTADRAVVAGTGMTTECTKERKFKYWCEICNIGAEYEVVMESHMLGRKHKAQLGKQSCASAVLNTSTASSATKITATPAVAASAIGVPPPVAMTEMAIWDVVIPKEKVKDGVLKCASAKGQTADRAVVAGTGMTTECTKERKFKYWCEICNIGADCEVVMESHMLGRKHKAQLGKQSCTSAVLNTSTASSATKITATPAVAASAIGVPPPVAVTEMAIWDVVIPKEKVKDGVLKCASAKGQTADRAVVAGTGMTTECTKERKFKYWCEICNIGADYEVVMESHVLGRKHKAQLGKQSCTSAVLNTKNTSTASSATTITATPAAAAAAAAIRVPPPVAVTEMAIGDVVIPKEKVKDGVLKCASAKGQTADKAVVAGTGMTTECTKERKFKYWCEICNIGADYEVVMESHVLGRKHKAQLGKQSCTSAVLNTKNTSTASSATTITATPAVAAATISVQLPDAVTETVINDVVLQKERVKDAALEDASVKGQTADNAVVVGTGITKDLTKERKFKYWCEICNIGVHSEVVMESHMLGQKHKRNSAALQLF